MNGSTESAARIPGTPLFFPLYVVVGKSWGKSVRGREEPPPPGALLDPAVVGLEPEALIEKLSVLVFGECIEQLRIGLGLGLGLGSVVRVSAAPHQRAAERGCVRAPFVRCCLVQRWAWFEGGGLTSWRAQKNIGPRISTITGSARMRTAPAIPSSISMTGGKPWKTTRDLTTPSLSGP